MSIGCAACTFPQPARPRRSCATIVRAIEAQDPAAAQAALRKHLSGTLSAVNEICRQHPDYVIA